MRGLNQLAFALFAGASLAAASTWAEESQSVELNDLQNENSAWSFSLGKEFPGAEGDFRVEKDEKSPSGAATACLSASFAKGGNYVAATKSFEPIAIKKLTIELKTSDLGFVIVRLTDGTGQVHQTKHELADTQDWQVLTISDFAGKMVCWGGANDKKWHAPAKGLSINLDRVAIKRNPELKSGELRFGSVKAELAQ